MIPQKETRDPLLDQKHLTEKWSEKGLETLQTLVKQMNCSKQYRPGTILLTAWNKQIPQETLHYMDRNGECLREQGKIAVVLITENMSYVEIDLGSEEPEKIMEIRERLHLMRKMIDLFRHE